MSDQRHDHARDQQLMVRKEVLQQNLHQLRQRFTNTNAQLKQLRAEAESRYGTSDPQKLMEIEQKHREEHEKWQRSMDEAITKNETLVENVMKELRQIENEA